MKTAVVIAALSLSACAGVFQRASSNPSQVARDYCRDWLGSQNLLKRPERGSTEWYQLIDLCAARYLSAGGEIDRELARR